MKITAYSCGLFTLNALVAAVFLAWCDNSTAAPAGGVVASGAATITTALGTTTIAQSSANALIRWSSFNLGSTEWVQFIQPSSRSVAVNQVLGTEPSNILGHLSANGNVFLINPNGIVFGRGASVNVAGLVASALNATSVSFATGSYQFSGGGGAVLNQGQIVTPPGGFVALLGTQVANEGRIVTPLGATTLAGASAMGLNLSDGGFVNVAVLRGGLDTAASNAGLIQADGGQVLLTAMGAGTGSHSAVNNSGVIRAQTLEQHQGSIRLMGDMDLGRLVLSGALDASAPGIGNGGSIETSAAQVHIADTAQVSTASAQGKVGSWLIDPIMDFTIGEGGDIAGRVLSDNLVRNDVTIYSERGVKEGQGNVLVNDALTWTAPTTLTLNAANDVLVNAAVTTTGGMLTLNAVHDVVLNAAVTTTRGNLTMSAGHDVNLFEAITTESGNVTGTAGGAVNMVFDEKHPRTAVSTTNGDMSWLAGGDVNISGVALTTVDGNVTLSAGNGSQGLGAVVISKGTPLAAVTGPSAKVLVSTHIAAGTTAPDYAGYFTLAKGATLMQLVTFEGAVGATGAAGAPGATGATGATGAVGSTGSTGSTGTQGVPGAVGATGGLGGTGAIGPKGDAGATGSAGSKGSDGASGTNGTNGTNGSSGATGATGSAGTQGETGAVGGTGGTGSVGPKGDVGAAGSTGSTGSDGASGAKGATGGAGSQGETGVAGGPGATGDSGATGAPGPQGSVGATGARGAVGAVGSSGPQGETGLGGSKGADGAIGAVGEAGTAGAVGATGEAGAQGGQGIPGATGAAGLAGATGANGLNGLNGLNGVNGVNGVNGQDGVSSGGGWFADVAPPQNSEGVPPPPDQPVSATTVERVPIPAPVLHELATKVPLQEADTVAPITPPPALAVQESALEPDPVPLDSGTEIPALPILPVLNHRPKQDRN